LFLSWRASTSATTTSRRGCDGPGAMVRVSMKIRTAALAALLGLFALAIPEVAQAELKLAVLKVKGMVCSS